jgi:ABC-type transport system involved in multi-copper enzyme maturation permease subunit
MSAAAVIARQHVSALARRQTFVLMLGVLLLMTALSGFIGWSSHNTITNVYEETVRTLAAQGTQAPANPFESEPRLALLNNMIIYVPVIGALLAIIIGHLSVVDDRHAGVTRIIFSRPVLRSSYFWGKLAGGVIAGTLILAACLVLSAATVALVNGGLPTATEFLRLAAFYALSGLYLVLFVLIGIVTALLTRSASMALFIAVAVWVLITFATPQFTSGLRPVASLNPVTDPVTGTESGFFKVTSKAKPIAVNEQYRTLSSRFLTSGSGVGALDTAGRLAPMVAFALLLGAWAHRLVQRHDFSQERPGD